MKTKVIITEIVEDDQGNFIEGRLHQHNKHYLVMNLSGPSQSGLTLVRLQVYFCSGCKLAWFEELPEIPITGRIVN